MRKTESTMGGHMSTYDGRVLIFIKRNWLVNITLTMSGVKVLPN